MAKIYTKEGWVNWRYIIDQGAVFNMVVGARGTGKTYGLMKELVASGQSFIYLRRLKTQLDICCKPTGNPFKKLNADTGRNILPFTVGGNIEFRETDKGGTLIAVGVSLSTVATVRGIDFSEFDYILFDEAIPMIGEKPIKNEFDTFLNFYETVNRNRELLGQNPVKCFLLGNANKLSNPYFTGWHFMKTALRMIQGKQMVYRSEDNTRLMILLTDSPISKAKAGTALYKNSNEGFITMALDNAFRTDETTIHSEPLKEYYHIVSIGEIGIYRHKSERKYYVSSKTQSPYYDDFGMSLKMFRNDYMMIRVNYMIRKNVVFEDYESELLFREYFDLN
jgi:hypothetical protein